VLCSKLFGTIARAVCRRHFRSSNEKAKTTKMAILYNLRVYTKAQILNMILVTQFHTSDKARPMPSHITQIKNLRTLDELRRHHNSHIVATVEAFFKDPGIQYRIG